MLVLSHLFGRRPIRSVERESGEERVKDSVSTVFLKPLLDEAESILKAHNAEVLDTYLAYVSTYVEQHCEDPDNQLPLSKVRMLPVVESEKGAIPLKGQWSSTKLRSAFVSLSGPSDMQRRPRRSVLGEGRHP